MSSTGVSSEVRQKVLVIRKVAADAESNLPHLVLLREWALESTGTLLVTYQRKITLLSQYCIVTAEYM